MKCLSIILLSWLLLSHGLVSADEADKPPTVKHLGFEGNETFEDSRLQKLMVTSPSGFLKSGDFHEDVFEADLDNLTAFYMQAGFLDIRIVDTVLEVDTTHGRISILLRLIEGPRTYLKSLEIDGNSAFPDSVLRSLVPIANGDPFRRLSIEDGVHSMLARYADSGYIEAAIEPSVVLDTIEHRALVILRVTEHEQYFVGDVRLVGLDKTNPGVVTRELAFKTGDVVCYSCLVESQRRLYRTGLFESVFVRPDPEKRAGTSRRTILVELRERLSGEFSASVGYGSVEKLRGSIELGSTNLAGTARKAGIELHANFIRQGATVSFTEPRTFGSRWQTDASILWELQQEPGYDLTRYGGRVVLGRSISSTGSMSLTYRYENTDITRLEIATLPDDLEPRIRSLTLTYSSDTRDNAFDPRSGTLLQWRGEIAGGFLQGDNSFARTTLSISQYRKATRTTVLASAVRIGLMDNFGASREVPLNERFYTGGPTVLRSFGYQEVGPQDVSGRPTGGEIMLALNLLEIRQSLYKMFAGVVFADAGNVWENTGQVRLEALRYSLGVGLRAGTPLGIVRADIAFNPDLQGDEKRYHFYFSMGQAF